MHFSGWLGNPVNVLPMTCTDIQSNTNIVTPTQTHITHPRQKPSSHVLTVSTMRMDFLAINLPPPIFNIVDPAVV